jgi:Ribbon-helix-helix protein, copG family
MTKKPKAAPRGRKPLPADERKDSIIQARVPEELSEQLQAEAKRKRVSVSQLIRHVLEDTFDLVDDVVATTRSLGEVVKRDARRIAESAKGQSLRVGPAQASAPAGDAARLDTVDAWQDVIANREVVCAQCGNAIARGERALLGLGGDDGRDKLWLCSTDAAAL